MAPVRVTGFAGAWRAQYYCCASESWHSTWLAAMDAAHWHHEIADLLHSSCHD